MVVAVKSFQDAFYYYLWVAITHFIFSLFSLRLSSISESFLTVKGAALFLPRGNGSSPSSASRFSQLRSKHAGEVPNNNLLFNCINHAFNKKFVIYAKVQFLTLIEVVFIALISPGDIQQHLQTMFTLLRPEDNIKLVGTHFKTEFCVCVLKCPSTVKTSTVFFLLQAVRLESAHPQITRYMVVVSTNGRQDTEESVVLGMDFSPVDR